MEVNIYVASIGCRSPWTARTEHTTINDMMVQCLVAGDLEALFCYRWSLCERHYALISLPLPVKCSATYDQHEIFTLPCQVATEYVYVCECIWTYACICVHIYDCMHMYTCNKCVIENTTYCYICDKIQCDAVTARSVFSKHSHDRHTIASPHGRGMGCLLRVKSLISYSVTITAVLHTIWGLYSTALWRHSAVCTNCTALSGKKFLLTSGKGNMYWQYFGEDATKHHKGIENPRIFLHGYV